jgi:hypothetical protein
MRSRRIAAALAAAVILGASLTACQTIGSLADKVLIDNSLRDLKAQLETVDGVTATYDDPTLQGDYSYTAGITVTATEEASMADVVGDLRSAVASDVFQRNKLWASLTLDEAGVGTVSLSSFDIPDDQLQSGLARWHSVAEILQVPVNLSINDNGDGTYLTSIGTDEPATGAQLEQLSALRLPEDGTVGWGLPGLDALIPDAEGRAFFEKITDILPPISYSADPFHGVQLSWSPDSQWYVTVILNDVVDGDLVGSPTWPDVKRVLAAAIGSGKVRVFTVQVFNAGQGGAIHLGQCPAEVTGMDEDLALLKALDDVTLPAGSGAGWC